MSIEDTLKQRNGTHGDFTEQADLSQRLKDVLHTARNWYKLEPYMQEALDMVAHKMARTLAGDPYHADSWHDIAGYATLVEHRVCQREK